MDEPEEEPVGPALASTAGAVSGLVIALALILSGTDELKARGVLPLELALASMTGCGISGLIGAWLWRFQRTYLETALMAVPTALPAYLGIGWAMNLPIGSSAGLAITVAFLYTLIYGGRHRAPAASEEQPDEGQVD